MAFLQLPSDLSQLGFDNEQLIATAVSVQSNEASANNSDVTAIAVSETKTPANPANPAPINNASEVNNSAVFTNTNINYSIAKDVQVYQPVQGPPQVIENVLIDSADSFTISQFNEDGSVNKTFKFTLLPAIESSINGRQVPEVKPGILKRSSTNIKTFTLPGGVPVFQVLGLDTSILQLVGLFIGSENIEDPTPTIVFNNSKDISAVYTANSKLDATRLSAYFEESFVQTGRPVSINISTNNSNNRTTSFDPTMVLSYKALLQNVRYFIARQDRVYYSIDALVLDYPQIKTFRLSNSFKAEDIPPDIKIINDINVFNRDDEGSTSATSTNVKVILPPQAKSLEEYSIPEGYELKEVTVRWVDEQNKQSKTETKYFYVRKDSNLSAAQLQTEANNLYTSEMNKLNNK